jgi:peroxiredoxin
MGFAFQTSMAEVRSTFELRPGARLPEFELPDATGKRTYRLTDLLQGRSALVVVFACNHCPYVRHLAAHLGEMAADYASRNVGFVAINANDAGSYPEDAPEKMDRFAREHGWEFPYLRDESQEVAKAYFAACTPDFFVCDGRGELTYAGRYDGSRPGNGSPVTGSELRAAIEATLRGGRPDPRRSRPSTGCNIKWKKGAEPAWHEVI